MTAAPDALFSLLSELCGLLERLTAVAKRKTAAVKADDLNALDECIKQEQALSLALRGCDRKRETALSELGLSNTRLRELPALCPEGSRLEAAALCERLQTQYQLYRSAAEVARSTLECNLHQIEKYLSRPDEGAGFSRERTVQPPQAMKTDFHA